MSQPGEIFYEGNGHLYEVVLEYDVTATEALALASSRTKYGADGYLVTISNEEENTYVSDRLANAGWMGAGDADSEGSWEWVTGPETNTTFWTGGLGGSAVPG